MANLETLIGKLNQTCRDALMQAGDMSRRQHHEEVDIEHFLSKLLTSGGDCPILLAQNGVAINRLQQDLASVVSNLKGNYQYTPGLSADLQILLDNAWAVAKWNFSDEIIRSGYVLLALISDKDLATRAKAISSQFGLLSPEELKSRFKAVLPATEARLAVTPSTITQTQDTPVNSTVAEPPVGQPSRTPGLDQYTLNMTERARTGQIDPVVGRDSEIRLMIDILLRRRQNNPILTGEAGVGKTAVVEGFACKVAAGDVPEALKNIEIRMLDISLLQAGASMKGEFEERLKSVIQEVKTSPVPIILFIDEAHMLVGAGGAAGVGDAANIMKPALARGELRTIAATTWAEYKKYFENDAALTRRFQLVKIEEPDELQAAAMLRGLLKMLQDHHKVRILDEAIVDAVKLSRRYIDGRQLPDKAVSVLDTACARVSLGLGATPAALERCEWLIERAGKEKEALVREAAFGMDGAQRIAELDAEIGTEAERKQSLESRWKKESEIVAAIQKLQAELEQKASAANGAAEAKSLPESAEENPSISELRSLSADLKVLQADDPLIYPCVNADSIADVISSWTGIPVGKMLKDEIESVINISSMLRGRIVGQDYAIDAISQRIKVARTGLEDPEKPIGVFLLVGPSGVGKTETALALADTLYGGERNTITINMSEYQEAHTVSGLKGAPPGYVGYGKGGVLTEAVRRKPYSVVLLDEIEKAHADVLEMFYQVFDKGVLVDSEGVEVNFKNTVIILTSNVGTETVMQAWKNSSGEVSASALLEKLRSDLLRQFPPAFLGRMTIVPYFPLNKDVMSKIVELKLNKIKKRLQANKKAVLNIQADIVSHISEHCQDVDSGARNIDQILSGRMLPEISDVILAHMAKGEKASEITVSLNEEGQFRYAVS